MFQTKKFLTICLTGLLFYSSDLFCPARPLKTQPRSPMDFVELTDVTPKPILKGSSLRSSGGASPDHGGGESRLSRLSMSPASPSFRIRFPDPQGTENRAQQIVDAFSTAVIDAFIAAPPDLITTSKPDLARLRDLPIDEQAQIVQGLNLRDLTTLLPQFTESLNAHWAAKTAAQEREAQESRALGEVVRFVAAERPRVHGSPSFEAYDATGAGNVSREIADYLHQEETNRTLFKQALERIKPVLHREAVGLWGFSQFFSRIINDDGPDGKTDEELQECEDEGNRMTQVLRARGIDADSSLGLGDILAIIAEFDVTVVDDSLPDPKPEDGDNYHKVLSDLIAKIEASREKLTELHDTSIPEMLQLEPFKLDLLIELVQDRVQDWGNAAPAAFITAITNAYKQYLERKTPDRALEDLVEGFLDELDKFIEENVEPSDPSIGQIDLAVKDFINPQITNPLARKLIVDHVNKLTTRGRPRPNLVTAFLKAWANRQKIWDKFNEKSAKAFKKLELFRSSGQTAWPTRETIGHEYQERDLMQKGDCEAEFLDPNSYAPSMALRRQGSALRSRGTL